MTNKTLSAVQEAGVVGAGGGGFPIHAKLAKPADIVIINGAECEPLLQVDQQLMELFPHKIIQGLKAAMEAVGATRGVIGLKAKYQGAVKALTGVLNGVKGITISPLDDFYPVGDEHILVYEITGKIVPEGGIPLQAGVVVLNVETAYNIAGALQGIPLTHKFVSVVGGVKTPMTMQVPLGTPIKDLIRLAGGATTHSYRIIEGGPMMGREVNQNNPVTKTTKGVIVLPEEHPFLLWKIPVIRREVQRSMSICCQCQICSDLCPRSLLGHNLKPHLAIRAYWQGMGIDHEVFTQSFLCSNCGVCEVVCPAGIMPRTILEQFKNGLLREGTKNPHQREALTPDMLRELRRLPLEKLILRLGLREYYKKAPLQPRDWEGISPRQVELPLKQHVGETAKPVVKSGDQVKAGQLVAKVKEGALGASIHASISGTIKCYKDRMVIKKVSA